MKNFSFFMTHVLWVFIAFSNPAIGQVRDTSASSKSVSMDDLSKHSVQDSITQSKANPVVYSAIDSLYLPLDSLKVGIFAYQVLDQNSYARTKVELDTSMRRFEINNPVMKYYYAGSYLGNAGLSYFPIAFDARKRPSDFIFTDNLEVYMHLPENRLYYQTRTPYTLVDYSSAGNKSHNESILRLVHTQNVNKNWNVGLDYDVVSSIGQYMNQNASDNAFSFFSAYRGKQYTMYTNFNWNNIRMKENGGLANVADFMDDTQNNPETFGVRSMSGKTILRNRSFYLMQSYSFKKLSLGKKSTEKDSINNVSRFTLVQTFKYEWDKREYYDTATYAFNKPNFGTTETSDSIYFRRLYNHFELMIKEQARKKFTAGFSVGILNELDKYNTDIVPDTSLTTRDPYTPSRSNWSQPPPTFVQTDMMIEHRHTQSYVNSALTGRFFNHTGKYLNWDFTGRFYFTGYKMGNVAIDGMVQAHYYTSKGRNSLLLGGSIENFKPSYFLNNYESNWLVWHNNFNPSQEIRLRGEFVSPHRMFKVGAYVTQLNNYVYIDANAHPAQSTQALLTGTVSVEKDIRLRHFGFLFKLYGQYSSDQDIIPLPAFAAYQSSYFQGWLVRNVLKIQLGWDFNYHSKYYAYAYMPSSGMFYVQKEQEIGNYPFFDVFLNLQLRRARIFVKTEGLNTLLNSSLGKEYFMVYRYPLNEMRVKFGVSWAFYD